MITVLTGLVVMQAIVVAIVSRSGSELENHLRELENHLRDLERENEALLNELHASHRTATAWQTVAENRRTADLPRNGGAS